MTSPESDPKDPHEVALKNFVVGSESVPVGDNGGLFNERSFFHDVEILDLYSTTEGIVGFIDEVSHEDIEHNDWVAGVRELIASLSFINASFHDGGKIDDVAYRDFLTRLEEIIKEIESDVDFKNRNMKDVAERIAGISRDMRKGLRN